MSVQELVGVDPSEWIMVGKAAAILGRNHKIVRRLAMEGLIARHTLPGCRDRYLRADVLRLARDGLVPSVARERAAVA